MQRRSVLVVYVGYSAVLIAVTVLIPVALAQGYQDSCLPPTDPYPYKLEKSDPLYEVAREEHQIHLEDMEDYVNCLDRERGAALAELRSSFDLFLANFGKDAVLSYGADREARQ